MKRVLWAVMFAALGATALGQDSKTIAIDPATPPGNYHLTIKADGSATLVPLVLVSPTGTPTDPTDPPTDSRPFFFNQLPLSNIGKVLELSSEARASVTVGVDSTTDIRG